MNNTPSSPDRKSENSSEPPDDNRVRWFIVKWAVLLMVYDTVIYSVTKDINLLAPSTLLGTVMAAIVIFYFPKRRS